jgi:hypothetical protein
MYHLTYREIGEVIRHHRQFKYYEDMVIFMKRLNPTYELVWEEK